MQNVPNFRFSLLNANGLYYYATLNRDGSYLVNTSTAKNYLQAYPTNWRDIEITWKRNTDYWGIFRSMSTPMKFVLDGAAILHQLWIDNGVQCECTLLIEVQVDAPTTLNGNDGLRFETLYESQIDFSTVDDDWSSIPTGNVFTANTLDSELSELVKAYGDQQYTLNFGTIDKTTYVYTPSNGQWLGLDGINQYFNMQWSGPVDPSTLTTYDFTIPAFFDATLLSFSEIPPTNIPTGNNLMANLILQGSQIFVDAGSDLVHPFFQPYNTQNFILQTVSPSGQLASFTISNLISGQLRVSPNHIPGSGQHAQLDFVVWEINDTNTICSGGAPSGNCVTSGTVILRITLDDTSTLTPFIINMGGVSPSLPTGVTVTYPNADANSPYDAAITFNPNFIYCFGMRVPSTNTGLWDGTVLNFNWPNGAPPAIYPPITGVGTGFQLNTTGPVRYPVTACSFMRPIEAWKAIVPLLANTQGNQGYQGLTPDSFATKITAKSDFLSFDTSSGDVPPYNYQYWNNNPYNTALFSGSAARLFQVMAGNTIVVNAAITGNYAPNTYGFPISDGVNPPYIIPVTGSDYFNNAPYATVQGPYMVVSMNDIYKALDAIYGMALWFENDGDGNQTIVRLEPRQAVFDSTTQIADLGKVINFNLTNYRDIYATEITLGYSNNSGNQSWGNDDQFISQKRKLPTSRILNKADWTCAINASPYLHDAWRSNSQANLQTSFNANNDIGIISFDPTSTEALPGPTLGSTVTAMLPKRHISTEVYQSGLIYPKTFEYNIDLTPARNALRKGNWLSIMCYKSPYAGIPIQSYGIPPYTGLNIQLDPSAPPVSERGDIQISKLPAPLFLPEVVEFDCPTPVNMNDLMNANNNGYYAFTWKSLQWGMFVLECGIRPGDNNIYHFKGVLIPTTNMSLLKSLKNDVVLQ